VTHRLYLDDAYCFHNEAVITGIGAASIALDRTCMYPGGGGQPPDEGVLTLQAGQKIPINAVKRGESRILWHVCDVVPDHLYVGQSCIVHLNQERRLRLMRFHTALHVFNTVMLRSFDGWITGVRMNPDRSHIDFKVEYTTDMPRRVEDEVNQVIARQLSIESYTISADEFQNRPDLLRTLEAEPPIENNQVRVVEIMGFEAQACGGTHVRNTDSVGRIKIVKVDNKGKQNRRFYLKLLD
jgi:misacylated tRNA(Ala) deacylase